MTWLPSETLVLLLGDVRGGTETSRQDGVMIGFKQNMGESRVARRTAVIEK